MIRPFLTVADLFLAPFYLHAQTTNAVQAGSAPVSTATPAPADRGPDYLSPDEIARVRAAHDQVINTDPQLKQQEDDLRVQMPIANSATATDEQNRAFYEAYMMHLHHMREAMTAVDPSLKEIFQKIDEHILQAQQGTAPSAPASPSPGK